MAHHEHDAGHGNLKQYVVGFILSVLLTVVPFGMVMQGGYDRALVLWTIAITATAQVLVQVIFFLHINTSAAQRWNLIAFLYTVLTVATVLIGSIWIMNYLHELGMVM